MSTPGNVALLALLAALAAPVAQEPQPLVRGPVRLAGDGTTVELELDSVPLADFIEAAQPFLGVPIDAEPSDVSNTVLTANGIQRIPLAEFRDAFDAVLHRYDFWTWDDKSSSGTVMLVFKVGAVNRPGYQRMPFTPPFVTPGELAAGPKTRIPLYTTSFALDHVAARDLLVTVQMLLNTSKLEKVSHVEASNQLLVTASRDRLIAVDAALQRLDVPGPQSPGAELQLSDIRQRLSALEQRLTALEDRAGR